jgi:hypothetical protein
VSNPSLFFAIAGISMSFAGFAGLFLALRPHDAALRSYEVAQVTAIIFFALTAMFGALLVVPIASVVTEATALRAMSAVVLAFAFYAHQIRVGTAWLRWSRVQSDMPRREFWVWLAPFAFVAVAQQVLLLVNVFVLSPELYQLALITMLVTPALVFVRVVTQLGANPRAVTREPAERDSGVPAGHGI